MELESVSKAMEKLYQYLWKHRMLGRSLQLEDGTAVEVLSPGVLNTNSGPDFSNARVRIGGVQWAGNVEIHVHASDWYRHGHDNDAAYDSVMLHVVGINDRFITRHDGSVIPQVSVSFPDNFFRIYSSLSENIAGVKCQGMLQSIPDLVKVDWLESLAIERMQMKAQRIIHECDALGGDWERTTFVTLARSLGFGLNSEPFEILARSIPLSCLRKHSDNLPQLEALLFGQAGMLDTSLHIFDEYYQLLCREYFFLARKYGLRPLRPEIWKYSKTRPNNFPHRRIALLAKTLHGGNSLLSKLLAAGSDKEKLKDILSWELEGYWLTHSDFDRETPSGSPALGIGSINLLIINLAAPLIYAYAAMHGEPDKAEHALSLWGSLPAERNMYVRQWMANGFECPSAMRSQALLHLRKQYCDRNDCLNCRFGHWLLRAQIQSVQ